MRDLESHRRERNLRSRAVGRQLGNVVVGDCRTVLSKDEPSGHLALESCWSLLQDLRWMICGAASIAGGAQSPASSSGAEDVMTRISVLFLPNTVASGFDGSSVGGRLESGAIAAAVESVDEEAIAVGC